MHAAHQRGILHRDIKPANILLDGEGEPQVSDFGLVKRLDGVGETSALTLAGQMLGSPPYMAPELASGKGHPSIASDVYALGAVLYHALAGRPPFKSHTVLETLRLVAETEPAPLRRMELPVPLDMESICLKCLRKEPEKRYASAAALADDLACFQRGEPVEARPIPRTQRVWSWAKRHPQLAALGSVAALLFLALTIGGTLAAVLINRGRMEERKARRRPSNAWRTRSCGLVWTTATREISPRASPTSVRPILPLPRIATRA